MSFGACIFFDFNLPAHKTRRLSCTYYKVRDICPAKKFGAREIKENLAKALADDNLNPNQFTNVN